MYFMKGTLGWLWVKLNKKPWKINYIALSNWKFFSIIQKSDLLNKIQSSYVEKLNSYKPEWLYYWHVVAGYCEVKSWVHIMTLPVIYYLCDPRQLNNPN